MNNLNRIHKLIGEIAEVVGERFPEFTDARISIASDGQISFVVTAWDDVKKYKSVEVTPRRYIHEQMKFPGKKWAKDSSKTMNDYFRQKGNLFEGGGK